MKIFNCIFAILETRPRKRTFLWIGINGVLEYSLTLGGFVRYIKHARSRDNISKGAFTIIYELPGLFNAME